MGEASPLLEKVEALLRAAENRGFGRLEYAEGPLRLHVTFADGLPSGPARTQAVQAPVPPAEPGSGAILSSGVGFFRCAHPAGERLPGEGDAVAAGAVVALIQAGPLLQPVTAPRAGRLGRRLAAEGAGVGFGTALFLFD